MANILTKAQEQRAMEALTRGHSGRVSVATKKLALAEVERLAVGAAVFRLLMEELIDIDYANGELQIRVPHSAHQDMGELEEWLSYAD